MKIKLTPDLAENSRWSDNYRTWLYGVKNLERWKEIIGFNNTKHLTKYLVWEKYGYCPAKTTLKDRYNMLNGPVAQSGSRR